VGKRRGGGCGKEDSEGKEREKARKKHILEQVRSIIWATAHARSLSGSQEG